MSALFYVSRIVARPRVYKITLRSAGAYDKTLLSVEDIVMRLNFLRNSVYYTAWQWDRGEDITIEASSIKAMGVEMCLESAKQATQIMGGDGVNRFYPVQNIFEVAKTEHVAGGTVEACRMTVYRSALKLMKEDIEMQRRVIDEESGVPVPVFDDVAEKLDPTAENILKVLAEDYRANPGLHMTMDDLRWYIDDSAADMQGPLEELEKDALIMTLRNKKTGAIELAKANYDGLKKANPKEHYRWFPDWVSDDRKF